MNVCKKSFKILVIQTQWYIKAHITTKWRLFLVPDPKPPSQCWKVNGQETIVGGKEINLFKVHSLEDGVESYHPQNQDLLTESETWKGFIGRERRTQVPMSGKNVYQVIHSGLRAISVLSGFFFSLFFGTFLQYLTFVF